LKSTHYHYATLPPAGKSAEQPVIM